MRKKGVRKKGSEKKGVRALINSMSKTLTAKSWDYTSAVPCWIDEYLDAVSILNQRIKNTSIHQSYTVLHKLHPSIQLLLLLKFNLIFL